MVGINTWYTSSLDVTVQKVITTWLQYNNTLIPANSTTITYSNATNFEGTYSPVVELTSVGIGSPTATETFTDPGYPPGTETLYSAYSVFNIAPTQVSGLPVDILPTEAALYGATSVGSESEAIFPSQTLTVMSPTPFFLFPQLTMVTSAPCQTVINPFAYNQVVVPNAVAMPFPDGDYSDFNFTAWMYANEVSPGNGEEDAYSFPPPSNLASFLGQIPYVTSHFPGIESCSNGFVGGEPTVRSSHGVSAFWPRAEFRNVGSRPCQSVD